MRRFGVLRRFAVRFMTPGNVKRISRCGRCKLPAVTRIARGRFLTSLLPSDIVRSSVNKRRRAPSATQKAQKNQENKRRRAPSATQKAQNNQENGRAKRRGQESTLNQGRRRQHYIAPVYIRLLSVVGRGGVAQLGERLNGIQEVRGSIPLTSIPAADAIRLRVRVKQARHTG